MVTLKEKFLAIKTWDEFDARREEFRPLKIDEDTNKHFASLLPESVLEPNDGIHHEVPGYFHPAEKQ